MEVRNKKVTDGTANQAFTSISHEKAVRRGDAEVCLRARLQQRFGGLRDCGTGRNYIVDDQTGTIANFAHDMGDTVLRATAPLFMQEREWASQGGAQIRLPSLPRLHPEKQPRSRPEDLFAMHYTAQGPR